MYEVQGWQLLAYELAWYGVITIVVLTRLYIRVRMIGGTTIFQIKSWRWSDFLIILAWLLRTALIAPWCIINDLDGYRSDYLAKTTPEQMIRRNFYQFIVHTLYCPTLVVIKCAVLSLFAEFVPKVLTKVWIYIRATGGLIIVHGVVIFILQMTACIPISSNWDKPIPTCGPAAWGIYIWAVPHIITDLMIISIPFTVLHLLKNLTPSQRVVGYVMFSLGFINIGCAIVNNAFIFKSIADPYSMTAAQLAAFNFISFTEPPLAICIACIPTLRVLFTRSGREKLMFGKSSSSHGTTTLVEVVPNSTEHGHDTDVEAGSSAMRESKTSGELEIVTTFASKNS